MATKLTRLTYKIAIQLNLVAESCVLFAVLASGGQSGNFWYTLVCSFKSITNCQWSHPARWRYVIQ